LAKSGRTRLLKAKYYQAGEITDIVFRSQVSLLCTGVDHGLELLKN